MIALGKQHASRWLVQLVLGAVLFALGLTILRWNPYWRLEPNTSGFIDHHVYRWNGIGHLVAALGLSWIIASAVYVLLRQLFRPRLAVALILIASTEWLTLTGVSEQYVASFHWDERAGITNFRVTSHGQGRLNPLWWEIIRWQIEPELDGYMRGGNTLERADGEVDVTVVNIVPIATTAILGDGYALRNVERRRP